MAADDADLARQAADPATPLTRLQELARDHPQLRPAIAANPSTYPALLEWLGQLGSPDVDAALARRGAAGGAAAQPAAQPAAEATADPERTVAHPAPSRQPGVEDTVVRPAATVQQPVTGDRPAARYTPASGDEEDTAERILRQEPPTEVVSPPRPAGNVPPVIRPASPQPRPQTPASAWRPGPAGTVGAGAAAGAAGAGAAGAAGLAGTARAARTSGAAGSRPTAGPLGLEPDTDDGIVTSTNDPQGARMMWLILALVLALVVAGLIWLLGMRGDDDPADTAAPTAPTSAPTAGATTEPLPTTQPPAEDPAAPARDALNALPGATSCSDPAADARVFTDFAAAAAPDGTWADPASEQVVMTALTGIQDRCGPPHAVAVADALTASGQPALASTLAAAGDWVAEARPAPEGARQVTDFFSPSRNIACTLGGGTVRCSIGDRQFADPQGCAPDQPVTVVVGTNDDARADCSAEVAAGTTELPYGQSATAEGFACTSSADGVECWSTLSGKGFALARAGIRTF